MSYFGETISYSGLLGIALGLLTGVNLTIGVLVAALVTAALLAALQNQRLIPADALMGILAHVSLAAGVVAATFVAGARFDLMGFLFGDILSISKTDIGLIAAGGTVVSLLTVLLWPKLLAIAINGELARAEGIAAQRMEIVFILLLAVTVALAMKAVGILLITSFLIFPAAASRNLAATPEQMAGLASAFAVMAVLSGLAASLLWDVPAGPAIVLSLGGLVVFAALVRHLRLRMP
jgi:zinc transport system permease protein